MSEKAPHIRFKEAREQAGLTHDEAAERMGISSPCVWDIEGHESELFICYSLAQITRFCRVLKISPAKLFGCNPTEAAINDNQLLEVIRTHLRKHAMTISEFEDKVGWKLNDSAPSIFSTDSLNIDALKDICAEAGLHWHGVIQGRSEAACR